MIIKKEKIQILKSLLERIESIKSVYTISNKVTITIYCIDNQKFTTRIDDKTDNKHIPLRLLSIKNNKQYHDITELLNDLIGYVDASQHKYFTNFKIAYCTKEKMPNSAFTVYIAKKLHYITEMMDFTTWHLDHLVN